MLKQLIVFVGLGTGLGILLFSRDQVDAQKDALGDFFLVVALTLHFFRELGLGDGHAVLHQHLRGVQVGSSRKVTSSVIWPSLVQREDM
ncbi:MAG: hypothetical protein U1D30_23390 [Planctomycetota bacterium]